MIIICVPQSCSTTFKRLHKNRLHSYLSATNEYVGLKIGEATNAGAWDWNHEMMQNFKDLLLSM